MAGAVIRSLITLSEGVEFFVNLASETDVFLMDYSYEAFSFYAKDTG